MIVPDEGLPDSSPRKTSSISIRMNKVQEPAYISVEINDGVSCPETPFKDILFQALQWREKGLKSIRTASSCHSFSIQRVRPKTQNQPSEGSRRHGTHKTCQAPNDSPSDVFSRRFLVLYAENDRWVVINR